MRLALVLVVGLAAVAACSSAGATPVPEGTLMAVQVRGGICPDGGCETTLYLERNGFVHAPSRPNGLGVAPAEALTELETQIAAADFQEIRSHRFDGTCPTAFDGQETVFEFQTAHGIERIESCQTVVDYSASPLFAAVLAALAPWMPVMVEEPVGPDVPQPPPVPLR